MNSDTQLLYDAIISLGRSAEDAGRGLWTCGLLGESHGPKCVNGLLTIHLGSDVPDYITSQYLSHDQVASGLIAGRALLATRPAETEPLLAKMYIKDYAELGDAFPASSVENFLIDINDAQALGADPVLTAPLAAAWFWRAFDLLAKQLPEPNVLTVDDIVGAPQLETFEEPVAESV